MLKKLSSILTKRDKQFLFILFLFSILISLIETVGISAIMPFISVATDFESVQTNEYYNAIYTFFGFKEVKQFVIAFGVLLICFYIFRSIVNFVYFYFLNRFSQGRYHLIAYKLFDNYLNFSYQNFTQKNSSTLTKSIVTEAANLTTIIQSSLFLLSEVCIFLFLYIMLMFVNFKITLLLTAILIINAFFLTKTVTKRIKKAGEVRAKMQSSFYEIINKAFGNFKFIKLTTNELQTLNEFSNASLSYAQANIRSNTLSHFPRLFLEAIGFGLVVFIITFLVWKYENNTSNALSMLSMFVLALYRLMPSVNRIMSSINTIGFNYRALDIIHDDLLYPVEELGNENIDFYHTLELKNLSFEYENNKPIFHNVNLQIKKNEKVAFIGKSGSGKSTLIDVLMGLYKPVEGIITIDGNHLNDETVKAWRNKIGYIPQDVYLFDGTIAENIIFGNEYHEHKLLNAIKQANLDEFLENNNGVNTYVGENGVMLSGGQKQRVAIARALYSDPEVLVLDEATSALDYTTEEKIMDEIYKVSEDKTLIIIAHRVSTVKKCDKVYEIKDGILYEK